MLPSLKNRWNLVATPGWVAPLFLVLATTLALLSQLVERGSYEPGFALSPWPTPASSLCVALYLLAWLLETSGMPWPRWLFAILACAPVFPLLYWGRDTLAPFLPMLVLGWMGYTASPRTGLLAFVLAVAIFLVPLVAERNVPERGTFRNLVAWTFATLVS